MAGVGMVTALRRGSYMGDGPAAQSAGGTGAAATGVCNPPAAEGMTSLRASAVSYLARNEEFDRQSFAARISSSSRDHTAARWPGRNLRTLLIACSAARMMRAASV